MYSLPLFVIGAFSPFVSTNWLFQYTGNCVFNWFLQKTDFEPKLSCQCTISIIISLRWEWEKKDKGKENTNYHFVELVTTSQERTGPSHFIMPFCNQKGRKMYFPVPLCSCLFLSLWAAGGKARYHALWHVILPESWSSGRSRTLVDQLGCTGHRSCCGFCMIEAVPEFSLYCREATLVRTEGTVSKRHCFSVSEQPQPAGQTGPDLSRVHTIRCSMTFTY